MSHAPEKPAMLSVEATPEKRAMLATGSASVFLSNLHHAYAQTDGSKRRGEQPDEMPSACAGRDQQSGCALAPWFSSVNLTKPMKIYKVLVEYETVIRAESAKDAENQADYIIRHECDSEPRLVAAKEVTAVTELPEGWKAQCRPWGERDPMDRTLGVLLNGTDEAR